ncbi:MAG: hypothetical protein H7X71_07715 [Chitinophagales bacterium]|nr:hypothetical protein [Chitinophagales bacterium]
MKNRNTFNRSLFLLRGVASAMYLILGALLLFRPDILNFLDEVWSRSLGAVLFVYGLFRGWRVIQEIRDNE